jgi:hypothetical protein
VVTDAAEANGTNVPLQIGGCEEMTLSVIVRRVICLSIAAKEDMEHLPEDPTFAYLYDPCGSVLG